MTIITTRRQQAREQHRQALADAVAFLAETKERAAESRRNLEVSRQALLAARAEAIRAGLKVPPL